MPIPFLNSITLNKNEIQEFKVYNLTPDPTLTSAGDYGYMWLNTSDSPKTLKWWDGTSIRSIVDSGNTSTLTVGTANDLSGGVAGSLPYQQGVGDTTFLGIGSSGYILTSTGSAPQWSASIPSTSVSGLAASATTDTTNASNISSGTLGLARLSLASGQFYVGDGSNNPAATAKSSIPLSGFGNAAADINIGGFKITNSGTIGSGDADSTVATKGYVDSVAQGLDVKASCLVATTADITLASPGAVTIDGIYSATDFTAGTTRILVKDQSAPAENGIYIWQGPSSAMTRSSDANTWDELVGAFTFVERGTANADSGWVCTVNAGGTLGSTAVTFVKFSQAGSYTAGNGIVQSGTSFNFAQSAAYTAGQIPFAGGTLGTSSTTIGFDSNFVWDDQANRLGIGTATPAYPLSVNGRISYSGVIGEGADATLSSSGTVLLHGNSSTWTEQRFYALGNEQHRISSSGVFTWYDGAGGTRMTLNGTGLGVGASPSSRLTVASAGSSGNSTIESSCIRTNVGGTFSCFIGHDTTANRPLIQASSGNAGSAIDLLIQPYGGNVGIGTASPSSFTGNLKVAIGTGSGVAGLTLYGGNATFSGLYFADGTTGNETYRGYLEYDHATDSFAVGTAGANKMFLTSGGNLGLGVTPSAWTLPAFQSTYGVYSGTSEFNTSANAYYDGQWKHISNAAATRYSHAAGVHYWFNKSAGTGVIAWTQAMTLFSNGALSLGTASDALSQPGNVYLHGDSGSGKGATIAFGQAGAVIGSIGQLARIVGGGTSQDIFIQSQGTSNNVGINAYPSGAVIYFQTQGTERLRIKSTGQVNFVGQASDPAGAAGDVVYNSTSNRLKYHNGTAWVNTGTNKYSGALAGTGTSFTVTHNLGTRDVTVAVRKSGSTYDQVFTDVQMTDTNTVTIVFASSVTGSDYTVTVIG